jgi:hypothetical protein
MEIPAQSIPTAYLRSSVFKRGFKTHEFVNKNEISDFPSADKVRRHIYKTVKLTMCET